MKIHTKILAALCLILLSSLCFTIKSYAGGWPTRKGRLLISPSINFFYADKYWDRQGKVNSYENDGYFTSTGFGDVELGARYYIGNIKYKYYFAIQGLAILPPYKNTANRYLGYEAAGADVRLIGSCSGKLGSKTYYFNLEGGVRQYFTSQGPFQVRYFSTFGYNFATRHQVTLSASGVISSSTNKEFSGNLPSNRDFSYLQGTLSYGYTIQKDLLLFAGVSRFLTGKNTGIGTNGSLSLVIKL